MPSTATQRKLVTQFISVTNATKEHAALYLKNSNYNLDAAVNLYYTSRAPDLDEDAATLHSARQEALNEIFNSLRGRGDAFNEKGETDTDAILSDSIELYTKALSIKMNYEFLVLWEILRTGTFGQISRKEFVDGWKNQVDAKNQLVKPNMDAHKEFIRGRIQQLPKDPDLFKRVYRQTFISGKDKAEQKSMAKEMAIGYWDELFSPGLRPWATAKVNWLEEWKRYLVDNWKRPVNKDMWNQTLEFALKTMEDDTLGFWSEDQAWPGVVDDFVVWCRDEGIVASPKKSADGMEVDE